MRYLLDTNIILYYATDHSKLDKLVIDILQDVENILCISAETVREIIVLYKNEGFLPSVGKHAKILLQVWKTILVSLFCRWIKM